MNKITELKKKIIDSGYKAVEELIKVAEEKIVTHMEDDLSADKLKNAAAAKKLADFMLTEPFQKTLADTMYVYPTLKSIALPKEWSEFAPAAEKTVGDTLQINANRKDWLSKWSDIFAVN